MWEINFSSKMFPSKNSHSERTRRASRSLVVPVHLIISIWSHTFLRWYYSRSGFCWSQPSLPTPYTWRLADYNCVADHQPSADTRYSVSVVLVLYAILLAAKERERGEVEEDCHYTLQTNIIIVLRLWGAPIRNERHHHCQSRLDADPIR